MASGTIPIFGVPIPITLFVQVFVGYSANVEASGSISGTATATGGTQSSVTYDPSTGVTPTGSAWLNGAVSFNQPQFKVQAEAKATVTPQFFLQAAYIGGPIVSLTAYADATLPTNGCSVTTTIGAQVGVGAKIDIDFDGINALTDTTSVATVYGPTPLWSYPFSIC